MKYLSLALMIALGLTSCGNTKKLSTTIPETPTVQVGSTEASSPLATKKDSISYAIGMSIGRNLKQSGPEVNPETFAQGLNDVFGGGTTLLGESESEAVLMQMQQDMEAEERAKAEQAALESAKLGKEYLAKNAELEGVTVTSSGLQYQVLKEGTGKKPLATNEVVVHYEGTLIDGTVFDSSYERGETIAFPLNQVIPGWTEGVQLMNVGSIYRFVIPSELAYGERGAGANIPGRSTLIFKVELFEIK